MTPDDRLRERLASLGIAYSWHEHEAVFTVAQSAHLHEQIPGAHTKNLFMKDAGGKFWLVTAPHDLRVDLKALPNLLGSRKLSFGKADDMERLLGISPGSVTPLATLNDVAGEVCIVIDARLAEHESVNVHPLRNTATLGLPGADLLAFLESTGHKAVLVPLPAQK